MTETGFDWRRLAGAVPEVHAEPQRSAPVLPVGRWLAIAGLVAAGVVMSVILALSAPRPEVIVGADVGAVPGTPGRTTSDADAAAVSPTLLTVDVDGAVLRPGLVTLPAGSRIGDAIAAAGGFAPMADARAAVALNLAAPLTDGDQVTVPDRAWIGAEDGVASTTGPDDSGPAGPIDLDRATAAQLDTLPGIGPVTAEKILAARDEAPFQGVDDLRSRKLVGAATFEKIKDLVSADGR